MVSFFGGESWKLFEAKIQESPESMEMTYSESLTLGEQKYLRWRNFFHWPGSWCFPPAFPIGGKDDGSEVTGDEPRQIQELVVGGWNHHF